MPRREQRDAIPAHGIEASLGCLQAPVVECALVVDMVNDEHVEPRLRAPCAQLGSMPLALITTAAALVLPQLLES